MPEKIFDSRDIIARIEELEDDIECTEELDFLREFRDSAENECDWEDGTQFIHESYFTEYARELAEELGLLDNCDSWPLRCIDWEQAADELKSDYTSIYYGDELYYFRV